METPVAMDCLLLAMPCEGDDALRGGGSSGLAGRRRRAEGEASKRAGRRGDAGGPRLIADVAFRQRSYDWAPETFYYFTEKGKRVKWTALYPAEAAKGTASENMFEELPKPCVEDNRLVYDESVWARTEAKDPMKPNATVTVLVPKSAYDEGFDVDAAVKRMHRNALTEETEARNLLNRFTLTQNAKELLRSKFDERKWEASQEKPSLEPAAESRKEFIAAEKQRKQGVDQANRSVRKEIGARERGKAEELERQWTRSIFNPLRYYYAAMATQRNLWYYRDRLMVPRGPCSVSTLKRCWAQGIIDGDTLIWGQGMMEFAPIKNVFTLTGQIRSWDVRLACAIKKPFMSFAYWSARKNDWKNRRNVSGASQLEQWR